MNLDEIQSSWAEDSKLDPDNLHNESIKIPSLHSKYYNIYNNIVLLKKMEENKYKILKKKKWHWVKDRSVLKRRACLARSKAKLNSTTDIVETCLNYVSHDE